MTGLTALVLRHAECRETELLEEMMREKGISYTIADIGPRRVPDPSGYGLLISVWDPMIANYRYEWVKAELEMTRAHVDAGGPYLGIGNHMLIRALGARVVKSPVNEFGCYEVFLTSACPDDPVLRGLGTELPVFLLHGETFELPEGAERLAVSLYYDGEEGGEINQVIRLGNAYCFQSLLGATESMVAAWISAHPNAIPNGTTAEGMLGMFRLNQRQYEPVARTILSNFLDFALSTMRTRV